ncbi:hypothetical protein D9980_03315 [Serratia sp. 3ACOL1]|uniref:hypothetical protein n=1 Tax=Serratia sp. 3ACOL1 TaxID=2448483 RepID=UPI000EF4EEBD|nr:hypothetical protein [Serratia sp. 3ACOL1]AYM89684.1 hypothetical protein D9980_03315 [Serratia sp. 3ACOL1]
MLINGLDVIQRENESIQESRLSHKSATGKVEHDLFMLTILFYPIVTLSHILYILPQALLTGTSALNRNKAIYKNDVLAFLFGLAAFLPPFIIEFSSSSPNYDLSSKLVVNCITIFSLIGTKRIFFTERSLSILKYISLMWLIAVIIIYMKNGVTSVSYLLSLFNTGADLDSSSLYGIAEPLRDLFLTKNISSMFVVSTFSLYLYIAFNLNQKVGVVTFLLFSAVALSFLSRQALVGMLLLYGFYRFLIAGYFSKISIVALISACGFIVFISFFNLKNSNDGASQRIELWQYFFEHCADFVFLGNGMDGLSNMLTSKVGIDNFHMFFMNQIGAYGIFHFIAFSVFLLLILCRPRWNKGRLILLSGYLLNVCFQTYGYEYGNLFLFMSMLFGVKKRYE